jgi:hypothetical protein
MLPTDAKARKAIPIYTGFVKYFPKAMAAVAQLSQVANEQHNPGQPVHWAKEKSTDEPDALMRHLTDQAQGEVYDGDGILHATKVAWRAMANLERLLDSGVEMFKLPPSRMDYMFGAGGPCVLTATELEIVRTREGSRIDFMFPEPEADGDTHLPPCEGWGCTLPACREPVICGDCGADLDETGHFTSCLSQAAHNRR